MNRRGFLTAAGAGALLTACSPKPEASDKPPTDRVDKSAELEIAYAIELDDSGNAIRVKEDRAFRSGDRFRFIFRPAFDAHVYLFNRGPGQASFQALFPSSKIAVRNPIASGKSVTVPDPDTGWLRMDERKGEENLVMIASVAPLEEMEAPEGAFSRDEFESRLSKVERRYKPASSRRFEDKDWVKLFAARDKGDMAIVLRLPLLHA